ncbi:MAG: hypothetical protein ACAH95_00340 [Fimbriimonas sp.]
MSGRSETGGANFASVPQFLSSDPWLTAAYWYRWYGLRLNTVDLEGLPISGRKGDATFSPFVTEGIGFFRNFITYSAQAHLREVAWMHDPSLTVGILENLAKCQRDDGSFPGHNYSARPPRDFYHADFATGTSRLDRLHGVAADERVLSTLERYAEYFIRERRMPAYPDEPDIGVGIFLIFDQNETGQEYMSRYQFASEHADKWEPFRVGGVDATTYMILLFEYLADTTKEESWSRWSNGIRSALEQMCRADRFFFDNYEGRRSPAEPATGFYPFLLKHLGMYPRELIEAMYQRLLSPNCFWLPKGFPATTRNDATFSGEGEWKEKRLNCPWNGRSWPMVNSHLVDALANVARQVRGSRAQGELCSHAAEALMKAIRLMFHHGDPTRPNSYEHYDPVTGLPALYRGYDDYMHSWIVDLILRHAVGVVPGEDFVDPLPLDVDWIECTNIPHPRGRMDVRIERGCSPAVLIRE